MALALVPMTSRASSDAEFPFDSVRQTYIKKLLRYKLSPLLVSSLTPLPMLNQYLSMADGALFTGGGDFDARHYGQVNHPLNDQAEPLRDAMELYLLKRILKKRIPLLAICRGAQALNIASGGNLCQHLDPLVIGETHEASTYAGAEKNENEILVFDHTLAIKILKKSSAIVNCAHHQAVAELGKDFCNSAQTAGGVIEIIEHRDISYFCMGVQSHPEQKENGPLEPIFPAFARAVKKYAKTRH